MRKIINSILIIAMVLSFIPSYAQAEAIVYSSDYSDAYKLLLSLGILRENNEEEYNENSIVTRKEFASVIVKSFGEGYPKTSQRITFSDVEMDNEYYDDIALAVAMGIMKGYDATTFAPDSPVSGNEALKVIVSSLGYDILAYYKGGYPLGYQVVAKDLYLLKDTSGFSYNEPLTHKNFTRILINFLNTYPYKQSGVQKEEVTYSYSDKTFSETYLKIKYDLGLVNGNSETMLIDRASLSENEIYINDTIYHLGRYDDTYIGRNVEFFYSVDEQNENDIVAITLRSNKNKEIKLDGKDMVSFTGQSLNYSSDDKDFSLSLESDVKYVHNGKLVLFYDLNKVQDSETSVVIFVDNDLNGRYDIAFIYEYETILVGMINLSDQVIIDKESSFAGAVSGDLSTVKRLDLSEDKSKTVVIRDEYKNKVDFKSILENDVLSFYENDTTINVYVSKKTVNGSIQSFDSESIQVGNQSYLLSNKIKKTDIINLNSAYSIYLDVFNKVVYLKERVSGDYKLGYLVDYKYEESDFKDSFYKIFNVDGKFETLVVANKFQLNGSSYELKKLPDELKDYKGNFLRQLIKYKKNQQGELKEIITADTTIDENGSNFFKGPSITSSFMRGPGYPTWNGIVNADKDTIIFNVPADPTVSDESQFGILNMTNLKVMTNTIDSYYLDINSQVADVVILSTNVNVVNFDSNVGTLIRNSSAINKEGFETSLLTMYVNNKEVQVHAAQGILSIAKALDKGDVIRYELNNKGEVASIEWIFDASQKAYKLPGNPTNSGFDTSIRISYGTVIRYSDGFIRVAYDNKAYSPLEAYSLDSFDVARFNISSVNLKDNRILVSVGSKTDIVEGDKVIVVIRGGAAKGMVLIKD